MRKLLAALFGVSLTALMAYGMVGTGAAFTDHGAVYQTATIGAMQLKVSTTTGGAVISDDGKTLYCPALSGVSSNESDFSAACMFKIESVGSVVPSEIVVKGTTTSSPGVENAKIDIGKAGGGGYVTLPLSDTVLFTSAFRSGIDDGVFFQFRDLSNASAGGSISLVLSIDATE